MNLDELFNKLLNITLPSQFVIDCNEQKYIDNLKFQDIFDYIKSKNWHNEGKHSTPHSESLYNHLIDSGKLSYEKAVDLGYSQKDCVKAWLTGLLHDIGKPGTQLIKTENISFKGHGIVGSAMLDNFWSENISNCFEINKHDWGDICTCTCVHMCGYFRDQKSVDHMFNFQILPKSVKKMLIPLRYGDQLSLIPHIWGPQFGTTKEELDISENEFIENYLCEPNIDEYLNITKKTKGIIIQLIGTSSSGKTTFVKKLKNIFETDKIVHVSRDNHMVKVICEKYNIINKFNKETYQKCIKLYYDGCKKEQNIINQSMYDQCLYGLTEGKIVIIDSLITMYPIVLCVLPDPIKYAYKINIWFHRNKIITERLDISLTEQIKSYGNCNIFNPYRKDLNWAMLISQTENRSNENLQIAKADLSLTIGWNFCNEHVLNHLYKIINKIYDYNQKIPRIPDISQTMELNLLELVTILYSISPLAIDEFFRQYHYNITKPFNNVVGIKYIDGINKIWKPKWAREARGRFYYLEKDNIIELKYGLQRGIEVLTKVHRDFGINETQDFNGINENTKFDDIQDNILNKFCGSNIFKSYISAKVDGSLIIINVYPQNCNQYPIIKNIICNYCDSFNKNILNYCFKNNLPIVTISTQGTLVINEDMQDYFLTSIQDIYDIKNNNWIPLLVDKVICYVNNEINSNDYVALFFEAFCKNRTTINGKLHVELAVGYEYNGLHFIGAMYNNIYIPHFDLPNHTFIQPFYMEVNTTDTVYYVMDLLNQIVLNNDEVNDLLHLCPDKNTSKLIHPEGFVLLTPLHNGLYDYSKIKTTLYYECHKVKQNKISKLLQLNKNCEIYYPIIKKLKFFFNNLKPSLLNLIEQSFNKISSEINENSLLFNNLKIKAKQKILDLVNIGDVNNPVIYKILLNNKSICIIFEPIIDKIFTERSCTNDDFSTYIKKILIILEPWSDNDWKEKLNLMIDNYNKEISELYQLVIGLTD